jgi:hypothetical protein
VLRKRFYTQGLIILLRESVTLDAIEDLLNGFNVAARGEGSKSWIIAGPSLAIPYRPEANGYVSIDIVNHPWPDRMGDPKTEPELFGAWNWGHFGPGAWPGGLERACQHSWGWPDGRSLPLQHQAFIRIRSSYAFGTPNVWRDAAGDYDAMFAATRPEDYDPVRELNFVSRIAAALIQLPETLCYFNPNGECVRDPAQFAQCVNDCISDGEMPLYVWSNIRFFHLQQPAPVWNLMDTVGMSQLDAFDHEAFFQSTAYKAGDIDAFLRGMSAYVVLNRSIIKDGDTVDGPGNVKWQGFHVTEAYATPSRPAIRWFPQDRRKIPDELAKGPTPRLMSWKEIALRLLRGNRLP